MIDQLPDGKSIGWMQAPPEWIFTHTSRFLGIVHVVIQDGEGFILIKKGKPLVYFFKHGRIELRGHAALDYFNSHQTIEFNLCKYTQEELSQALKICDVEETLPETVNVPEQARSAAPEQAGVVEKSGDGAVASETARPSPEPPEKSKPVKEKPEPAVHASQEVAVPAKPASVVPERSFVPQPSVLEDPDIKIIGQIKKLNGIVAVSVFNDERNILLMGDVEIEPLLKIARAMLTTAGKITPRLDWGSFVHMTLQIPEGNVIIAPWHENHLCILTTRTINIGHIRRILRDLQQDRHSGEMT